MWRTDKTWHNPSIALDMVGGNIDVLQGLIPMSGITWLYGSSMSFKTFVAMSMGAAMSTEGGAWLGRQTESCAVVYIGAEGGDALHVRRAAIEMEAGVAGRFALVQERPQIDTRAGAMRLRGILQGLTRCFGHMDGPSDVADDIIYASALQKYDGGEALEDHESYMGCRSVSAVVCVIDTYSQTSGGDEKSNVASYIKALRDIIDDAMEYHSLPVSFLVVDHATKSGGSYMGSVAKLNDVDSQIEVVRDGLSNLVTLHHRKAKEGVQSASVVLQAVEYRLEGFVDGYGLPLASMVIRDGAEAAFLADVAEGKAGVLLSIVRSGGGVLHDRDLRAQFAADHSNEGIKADSVGRAYRRSLDSLFEAKLVRVVNGVLCVSY